MHVPVNENVVTHSCSTNVAFMRDANETKVQQYSQVMI